MSTNTSAEAKFGKIRSFLWPIHNHELKKIIPMLLMFFFISFNYSVLRNMKDALVVNAVGSPGAEIIPYLKLWLVIPLAFLFMMLFSKLSNVLSKKKLFYVSMLPFIFYFSIFAALLYPMRDTIHPVNLSVSFLPDGIVAMVRIWSFSLFYALAELWGSVMLSLLFWGFANDITKVEESKRFYALFSVGANVALEFSGRASSYFATLSPEETLTCIVGVFLVAACAIAAIYAWINKYVLTDPRLYDATKVKKKKKKVKMKLSDSFRYLAGSKYIRYIAILVLAYGISINLIEVTWKNQLKMLYPTTNEYLGFMGVYNRCMAWTTIFILLFVSSNLLRRFGWKFTALVTPVILGVSGVLFFGTVMGQEHLAPYIASFGLTPLVVIVAIGTFQNIISKASKYSLFDPTKEMTYIPLDNESKVKGKAAIDVVASRLGKAGGSLVQQILFSVVGPLSVVTPHIGIIVMVVLGCWIYAVNKLSVEFSARTSEQQEESSVSDKDGDTGDAVAQEA